MTEQEGNKVIYQSHNRGGRVLGGLIIVTAGVLWLLSKTGVVFPEWLFTWPMFLIAIGLFIGAKHSFRSGGWIIPIVIGIFFLADDFIPGFSFGEFLFPVIIIIAGLLMILRPKRKHNAHHYWKEKWKQKHNDIDAHFSKESYSRNGEDFIDSVCLFAGIKKKILTKTFKGGDLVCIFGGMEVDLMQADFSGKAELEVTQLFGGTKLLIPPHWEIQTESIVAVLGNIEDKRPTFTGNLEEKKVLVLKGVTIFGGIVISSF